MAGPPPQLHGQPSALKRLGTWLASSLMHAFYRHGLLCATNPVRVILGVTVVIVLVSSPALQLAVGSQSHRFSMRRHLWRSNPSGSATAAADGSGVFSSPPHWLHGAPSARLVQVLLAGELLDKDSLRRASFSIPESLANYSTTIDGKSYSLRNFCWRNPSAQVTDSLAKQCLMLSPAPFWDSDPARLEADASPWSTVAINTHVPLVGTPSPELGPINLERQTVVFGMPMWQLPDQVSRYYPSLATANAVALTLVLQPFAEEAAGLDDRLGLDCSAAPQRCLMRRFLGSMFKDVLGVDWPAAGSQTTYIRYDSSSRPFAEDSYLVVVYVLVFFYIYFSVGRFQFVKSKVGLGVAAVATVVCSMAMAVGISTYLGLITALTTVEVVPFLVIAIGLDNITLITRAVVGTSMDQPVNLRIAEGLARSSVHLAKSLVSMEILLLMGVYSNIAALQEFCIIASISLLCDFFLQVVLYVSVLSIDIRRMELSDLNLNSGLGGADVGAAESAADAGESGAGLAGASAAANAAVAKSNWGFADRLSSLRLMEPHRPTPLHPNKTSFVPGVGLVSAAADPSTDVRFLSSLVAMLRGDSLMVVLNNVFVILSMVATVILGLLGGAAHILSENCILLEDKQSYNIDLDLRPLLALGNPNAPPHRMVGYFAVLPPVRMFVETANLPPGLGHDIKQLHAWGSSMVDHYVGFIPPHVRTGPGLALLVLVVLVLVLAGIKLASWSRRALFGERQDMAAVAAFAFDHVDVQTFHGHEQDIECLAVTAPNGEGRIVSACLGGKIQVWDTETGQSVETLNRMPSDGSGGSDTMATAPWCVAAHGDMIAVGCGNGNVEVWDLESGACLILRVRQLPHAQGRGGITNLRFSEDSLISTSSTGVVERWVWEEEVPNDSQVMFFRGRSGSGSSSANLARNSPRFKLGHRRTGSDVSTFSDSGTVNEPAIMFGGRGPGGRPLSRLPSDSELALAVPLDAGAASGGGGGGGGGGGASGGFSPGGSRSTVMESGSTASLHSCPSNSSMVSASDLQALGSLPAAPRRQFRCVKCKACHKASITALGVTSRWIVTASADRILKVFRKDMVCTFTLFGHEAAVTALDVDEGDVAASGSADHSVRLWDLSTGKCQSVLAGHEDAVLCVRMNDRFVVSSAEDQTIRVWRRDGGRCVRTLHLKDAHVDFALHASSILITASNATLTAWDLLAKGERLRTISLQDASVPVALSAAAGSSSTNRLLLDGRRVVCDLGRLVKAVSLPFPSAPGQHAQQNPGHSKSH